MGRVFSFSEGPNVNVNSKFSLGHFSQTLKEKFHIYIFGQIPICLADLAKQGVCENERVLRMLARR